MVTRYESESKKNFFHAIFLSTFPQMTLDPITGIMKQIHAKAPYMTAIANGSPLAVPVTLTTAMKNAVIADRMNCPRNDFHMCGLASSMSLCCSSFESLSNPSVRMWRRPIGVLSEYHTLPIMIDTRAPISVISIMCVMAKVYNQTVPL